MRKVAVIGINYNYHMGMSRVLAKLQRSLHQQGVSFIQCGSSGWDLYNRILGLHADKIIILDQFENDEDEKSRVNYLTINDRILIIGIDPIFFAGRTLPDNLKPELEQIIFQIRRMIVQEISLDAVAQL